MFSFIPKILFTAVLLMQNCKLAGEQQSTEAPVTPPATLSLSRLLRGTPLRTPNTRFAFAKLVCCKSHVFCIRWRLFQFACGKPGLAEDRIIAFKSRSTASHLLLYIQIVLSQSYGVPILVLRSDRHYLDGLTVPMRMDSPSLCGRSLRPYVDGQAVRFVIPPPSSSCDNSPF